MKSTLTTLALTALISNALQAQTTPGARPFVLGETLEIQSAILSETRPLNVYLPPGYSPDSLKRYPVIYLLDGSADEDFIHIAGLVQFGTFSWINMLPKSIVVGIGNIDRRRDFTFPTRNEQDKKDNPTAGHSARFMDFIEKELQPFVERTYKTDGRRTIIGQSLGGLLATEILFRKPHLFDHYIIVSPSLWWDDQSLLLAEPAAFSGKKSVYIAVGKEGEVMERDAAALHQKLKSYGRTDCDLYFRFFEKQTHADVLHLAVYDAFEQVYRKR